MDSTLKFFLDLWPSIIHSPSWVIIGLVLMVVGFLCQKNKKIPNVWIPRIYVVLGSVFYPLLGDHKSIPVDQEHPIVLMVLLGVLLGFFSYASHFVVFKLVAKYLPEGFLPEESLPKPLPIPTENKNEKP